MYGSVMTHVLEFLGYILNTNKTLEVFSSPEPKAQVSYCHRNLSSVHPSVHLLTFSFKQLLLTNHLANFIQTWWET